MALTGSQACAPSTMGSAPTTMGSAPSLCHNANAKCVSMALAGSQVWCSVLARLNWQCLNIKPLVRARPPCAMNLNKKKQCDRRRREIIDQIPFHTARRMSPLSDQLT